VISRASLRILLGRYLHVAPLKVGITVDSYNKPRLADSHAASSLRFNVAHSYELALIAMTSGCEIGVDVERRREVRHAKHIARRYFHPSEIAAISAASAIERDVTFLRCWTGKEAVLKAIGTGITGSLAEFYIPDSAEIGVGVSIEVATHLHPQLVPCWVRRLDPDDDYLAALAVVGTQQSVHCMAFKP
jgi:4'-phosphopantetheinyl transferase